MDNLSVRQLNSLADSYPKNGKLQADKEATIILARRNSSLLAYSSKEILRDRQVALSIVKTDGRALRFFAEEIRSDEEVVLVAVENFCSSFAFALGKAKKSRKVAIAVAKRGSDVILKLDEEFLNDVQIALIAVERNPKAIQYFSDSVRADEKVVLTALSKDRTAVCFLSDDAFLSTAVFEKVALDYNGKIRAGILNNQTPQGLFDQIERKDVRFNYASQDLDLLTIDRDKLAVCLKLGNGAVLKCGELIKKYVTLEDLQILTLILERVAVPRKTLDQNLKYASANRKLRVIPLLLRYLGKTAGQGLDKDERIYTMRSLNRKSPKAVERFKQNYQKYLGDRELVFCVAKADGTVIKTLAETGYAQDSDFITECLKSYVVKISDGALLDGLLLPLTKEQAELACKKDGRNFFFLPPSYQNDLSVARLAVKSCPQVYDSLSPELKENPSVKKEMELWWK